LKSDTRLTRAMRRIPFSLMYVLIVCILYALSYFIPQGDVIPLTAKLTDPAESTLKFLTEMIKLITALNTALLGAAAAITVKGKEWSAIWSRLDGILILAILVTTSVPYYGIYLSYVSILTMVNQGTIYPFEQRLQWAIGFQYYGTLAAVFLLGLVFTRLLEGRRDPSNE
jgi:hypothetical protein